MEYRWSGPAIMSDSDAADYGVAPGSIVVWAGESDGSGHVDETVARVLIDHDAIGKPGDFATDWGPMTSAWIAAALDSMSVELGKPPGYLH